MAFLQPAARAGQGHVQRAHEHDADHSFKRTEREFFSSRDEIAGSVVDQHVERSVLPDLCDHFFHARTVAHVANESLHRAGSGLAQLLCGLRQHLLAASANVKRWGAEFEKAPAHTLAPSGRASGDQDPLARQQIFLEHELCLSPQEWENHPTPSLKRNSWHPRAWNKLERQFQKVPASRESRTATSGSPRSSAHASQAAAVRCAKACSNCARSAPCRASSDSKRWAKRGSSAATAIHPSLAR